MSGSIACAKATGLISAWVKAGHEVRVVTTPTVHEFVGDATLEGLSGHPVLDDVFAPGQIMDHVNLARWANLLVAAPATSNLIARFAAGIADDAPTTLWQAAFGRGYPLVVVPAMNTHLWDYPATKDNVAKLRSWGVHVLPTAEGPLADGEFGEGRMLEVEDILQAVARLVESCEKSVGKRILLTAGGTRVPLDSVRFIGNLSSGRTAATLAEVLEARGLRVTWLGAEDARRPINATEFVNFVTFDDLARELEARLRAEDFDAVIHNAAVSDFSVAGIEGVTDTARKLPSGQELTVHLKPNPKLLDQLRAWSRNPAIRIIGFKLTAGASEKERLQAVQRQFADSGVDAVVHNDLADIHRGQHPFTLHTASRPPRPCSGAGELAHQLADLLEPSA